MTKADLMALIDEMILHYREAGYDEKTVAELTVKDVLKVSFSIEKVSLAKNAAN